MTELYAGTRRTEDDSHSGQPHQAGGGTTDEYEDDLPFICPVTCQPCMTEQDEFCEDYGCARKAGIDVDRDLIF